jgi:hypothetical protein
MSTDLPGGPSEAAIEREPHLAFVVVDIGQRSHAEALDVLLDLGEHIDAMHGVITESWGSFPATERDNITAYVAAARALGTAPSVNEAWCRTDQTRQIVEWATRRAGDMDPVGLTLSPSHWRFIAEQITREFGGSDAD